MPIPEKLHCGQLLNYKKEYEIMKLKITLGFEALLTITLSIFLIYVSYQNYVHMKISIGSSLMSENVVTLIFRQQDLPKLSEMDLLLNEYEDVSIYAVISESKSGNLYGYYKNFNINTPLIELDQNITHTKLPQAVVGKSYLNSQSKSNNEFFQLAEKSYRIDGIISSDTGGILDNQAFIRLESNDILPSSKILIDGFQKDTVKKVVKELNIKYKLELIRNSENFIKKTMYSDKDMNNFTLLMVVFMGFLVLLMMIYSVKQARAEMRILWINGVKRITILKDSLKRLCIQIAIGFFIESVGYAVFYFLCLKNIYIPSVIDQLLLFTLFILIVLFAFQSIYLKGICLQIEKNGVKL